MSYSTVRFGEVPATATADADDTAAINTALSQLAPYGFNLEAMEGTPLRSLNEILRICGSQDDDAEREGEDDDAENMAELSEHYEKFAEPFSKYGITKAKLLSGFKAEKSRKPDLTAAEFLGDRPAPPVAVPKTAVARAVNAAVDKLAERAGATDEQKLGRHYELFSEQFEKNGLTKEKLLLGFKAEKARKPKLTAEEFLNV